MGRVIFLLCFIAGNAAFAQTSGTSAKVYSLTAQETMPVPSVDIIEYLSEHVIYPDSAIAMNIEGRVMMQFIITESGGMEDIHVAKGVHPLLDSAAVEALRGMAKWTPAMRDGKPVRVMYTQPITFKLPPNVKNTLLPGMK